MDTIEKETFTEVNLLDLQRKKAPKRLVYFSDGVLEEYSSDEEELDSKEKQSQSIVDPSTLKWLPYFGYMIWILGSRTLAVCDYLGENLAWILGITSPKYQYELDLHERMIKEEEELLKHIQEENAGWISKSANQLQQNNTVDSQPNTIVDTNIKYRQTYGDANTAIPNLV